MTDIEPYQIAVTESSIKILHQKLALTLLPTAYDAEDTWSHGAPLTKTTELLEYWKTRYSWRDAEARLNKTLPQFITPIETEHFGAVKVHFVHRRAENQTAAKTSIPLLFLHGWPGNFEEVSKILPLLTRSQKDDDVVFDVVAPSLVNFGFSGAVPKKGFGSKQQAETMHKLMLKLGYDKYVVQGGDLGWSIGRAISLLYPDHCVAYHTNFPQVDPPQNTSEADKHPQTPFDKHGAERTAWMEQEGRGYWLLQRTKPQTIGYLLQDSPVGLLGYLLEKLHDWSDSYPWTNDEILTWVSIYYFSTAGAAASVRIYREMAIDADGIASKLRSHVPKVRLGISRFHQELVQPARKEWCKQLGDLVFYNEHTEGGHFAAYENPKALVDDLRDMFGPGGGAEGVCGERTGLVK